LNKSVFIVEPVFGRTHRFAPNATELVKITLILSQKLLFFKEGGSEENSLFNKAWFPLRAYSPMFGMTGAYPQGGRGETFSKSFLRESGHSGMIIEVTK
jgi:hypothetical protein